MTNTTERCALDNVLGQIKLAHEQHHSIDTAVTDLGDYPDFDDAAHEIEVMQRALRNLERIVGRWEAE